MIHSLGEAFLRWPPFWQFLFALFIVAISGLTVSFVAWLVLYRFFRKKEPATPTQPPFLDWREEQRRIMAEEARYQAELQARYEADARLAAEARHPLRQVEQPRPQPQAAVEAPRPPAEPPVLPPAKENGKLTHEGPAFSFNRTRNPWERWNPEPEAVVTNGYVARAVSTDWYFAVEEAPHWRLYVPYVPGESRASTRRRLAIQLDSPEISETVKASLYAQLEKGLNDKSAKRSMEPIKI